MEVFDFFLQKYKDGIKSRNGQGNTMLHEAALYGKLCYSANVC